MYYVRFYRCYMYFRFAFLLVHHVCQSTSCPSHKVTCVNKLHCQILLVFIRSGRATGGMNNVISSVLSLATTNQLQVQAVPHTGVRRVILHGS